MHLGKGGSSIRIDQRSKWNDIQRRVAGISLSEPFVLNSVYLAQEKCV